jgi:hypothetical protein
MGHFKDPHVAKQAFQLLFRRAGYGSILGIKKIKSDAGNENQDN